MLHVSGLIGKPVLDEDGERVGRLRDLVVSARDPTPHPEIVAVVVKRPDGEVCVPYSDVASLTSTGVTLNKGISEVVARQPTEFDIHLVRDILDKEIIDTNGLRVVRVNDIEVVRVYHHLYLANVDSGALAMLRRLGLGNLAVKLLRRLGIKVGRSPISWQNVELVPGAHPMRLRVTGAKLADLRPADLAEIISDLSLAESARVVETLDVPTLADTLEEVEPDFQASLVEALPDEKVADVLEEMAPDEAADLLAELPQERSEEILDLMQTEEAEDVRTLLAYPEDSAGGIMTTAFVTIRPDLTAEEAINALRQTAREAETIFYVYVTDGEDRLLGVLSLQSLVLAQPDTPVTQIMQRRVVTVRPLDKQDAVAEVIARYNLLAVPVVDDEQRLLGIVTADDALDKIIPTAWKKRLPRLFH